MTTNKNLGVVVMWLVVHKDSMCDPSNIPRPRCKSHIAANEEKRRRSGANYLDKNKSLTIGEITGEPHVSSKYQHRK